jgi:hypothetical protein
MADVSPIAGTPPKKKPFQFKRKAVKQVTEADPEDLSPQKADRSDDELNLFRRSKDFFPQAVEERQKKRERRKLKTTETEPTEQSPKRRKVSPHNEDEEDAYGVSDREEERRAKLMSSRGQSPITPPRSGSLSTEARSLPKSTPRRFTAAEKGKGPAVPYDLGETVVDVSESKPPGVKPRGEVISLDSDSEDAPTPSRQRNWLPSINATPQKSQMLDSLESSPATPNSSEKPFEEYIIRAKSRGTLAEMRLERSVDAPLTAQGHRKVEGEPTIDVWVSADKFVNPANPAGPRIREFMARIRTSQPVKPIRDHFVKHAAKNGHPGLDPADVVLTWMGAKLWDTTTASSLTSSQRVAPDEAGVYRGRDGQPLERNTKGFNKGGLYFEAMTAVAYSKYEQERTRKSDRAFDEKSDASDGSDDEDMDIQDESQEPQTEKLRLTLKSQKYEPLKCTVQPTDSLAILVDAFRTQRGIGTTTMVTLHLDGEQLDEEATIGEADLADQDMVEVHVK